MHRIQLGRLSQGNSHLKLTSLLYLMLYNIGIAIVIVEKLFSEREENLDKNRVPSFMHCVYRNISARNVTAGCNSHTEIREG